MSAMIYYEELLYLFLFICNLSAVVSCICVSIAILIWCYRKIKEIKNGQTR